VVIVQRNWEPEQPVSNETFKFFRSLYDYERTPLNAVLNEEDGESKYWKKSTVAFDAAYGDRVTAYLFLPKESGPPYQTIVYIPGFEAFLGGRSSSSINIRGGVLGAIFRSGRAVLWPVYKGTFERSIITGSVFAWEGWKGIVGRNLGVQIAQDLRRYLDYLEMRSDIASDKLGLYGYSAGAEMGTCFLPIEDRLRLAVLRDGGFSGIPGMPEIDTVNFVSRVTIPVLMLNGKYDFINPLETSQKPFFRMLGTHEDDKKHVLFERSHVGTQASDMNEWIREILAWLDRYLGPVQ
jgi:dipeptidyl aminopeptidase/acylaminoacyl peptidase